MEKIQRLRFIRPGAARNLIKARTGLNIPKSTFYGLLADGEISSVKVGGCVLVLGKSVEEFCDRICSLEEREHP